MTGIGVVFGDHDIVAGMTTGPSDVEIVCISMGSQDRISGAIDISVIGIGHRIVKQLRNGFISPFGRGGLMGTNLAKFYKDIFSTACAYNRRLPNISWMRLTPAPSRVGM